LTSIRNFAKQAAKETFMKILLSVVSLISGAAFADTITMNPGSTITVNASETSTIVCGQTAPANNCAMRNAGVGNLYCSTLNGADMICGDEDTALADVKKMKEAGLCP
jgi:hypothetical protein